MHLFLTFSHFFVLRIFFQTAQLGASLWKISLYYQANIDRRSHPRIN